MGRPTASVSPWKFSVDLVNIWNWLSVCFQFEFIDNINIAVQLSSGPKTPASGKDLGKNEWRMQKKELKLCCNACGSLPNQHSEELNLNEKCQINEKKTKTGPPTCCANKQIYYTLQPGIYFSKLCQRWSSSASVEPKWISEQLLPCNKLAHHMKRFQNPFSIRLAYQSEEEEEPSLQWKSVCNGEWRKNK